MIVAPYPIAPQLGPLAAPSEEQLVAAYPELRRHALTLPWAAEALGLQPAHLVARARAGELLVVPGPWPMRQAHASDVGYLLPAWQLIAGRKAHPALRALIAAAAERGWTSLDLHRFVSTPPADGEPSPADLHRVDRVERALALLDGGSEAERRPPAVVHGQRLGSRRRRRPARRGERTGASR